MATDNDILELTKDSFAKILNFAHLEPEENKLAMTAITAFRKVKDKSSSSDDVRKIRLQLTKTFYAVYKKCFLSCMQLASQDRGIPILLRMFFNFGFMDEELAGPENTIFIYKLASLLQEDPNGHVYLYYDWLKAIYDGKKSPSVNDMSLDYEGQLRELKRSGKVDDEGIKRLMTNSVKKVEFEIDNAFRSMSRVVSGTVTTFCPIFCASQLYKPMDATVVSYKAIYEEIQKIRSVDFSCFYREALYTNPEIGVERAFIQKEVIPDIILMPNVGQRGSMWQDIEGKKRTTRGRFALPFFMNDDVEKAMIRMCAEFRWELCKRIQGARWNDMSDPSLTAEYCDYVETFKKNRELSSEQREKIKAVYIKCKKSSKEMFVLDYADYYLHESKGSLRLNKVARNIIFKYCPFAKQYREIASKNAMYSEIINRYGIKKTHELKLSDAMINRIEGKGALIPAEIKGHRKYLES